MEFELQYELDQFKDVQEQYFDEDNKCYTGINLSADIMEKMLSLIDNLSERVNELEPVIKQQIKKSLPIHGVVDSSVTISKQEYDVLKRDSENLQKVSFSM
jgi:hypothetical protein